MREKAVLLDLTKKGLAPIAPSLSLFEPVRLMNLRPELDGLHPEFRPNDINPLVAYNTWKGSSDVFTIWDNDASNTSSTNNLYILYNDDTSWKLKSRTYAVDQTTTPPSFTLGTETSVTSFNKNAKDVPCVIEAEGICLMSDGFTTYELLLNDSLETLASTAPGFLCGCYYNGQFVVGNIPTATTKFANSHSMIMWSDIGNTDFTAGKESITNTCTDQVGLTYSTTAISYTDNTIGFASLPAKSVIIGMHKLGEAILVMTLDGIYVMRPLEHSWSINKLSTNFCSASCLGNQEVIFLDNADNKLYKISMDLKIIELGYQHIFTTDTKPRTKIRYFKSRNAYQIYQLWQSSEASLIPEWESNFILTPLGLYQTSYKIVGEEPLIPYHKTFSADMDNKDTSFNKLFGLYVSLGTNSNNSEDCFIGLGPSNFGMPSDMTNIRTVKLIGSDTEAKTYGQSRGVSVSLKATNKSKLNTKVSYVETFHKEMLVRDFVVYPNMSGRELYMELRFRKTDEALNKTLVLSGLEVNILTEGAMHRRGQSVNTTNA